MTTATLECQPKSSPRQAERTFSPWFVADWRDALFVHFAVDPTLLQPHIPFDLDLFDGKAWISLVAFTQSAMHPSIGGKLAAWAMKPVATHHFLNVRTYVRAQGRQGIYFIAEWIPNRIAHLIGPRIYGLPFRLGRLDYDDETRHITATGQSLRLRIEELPNAATHISEETTLDHFLLERYTAFTARNGRGRMFHIHHKPWLLTPANVEIESDMLLRNTLPWFKSDAPACAHRSKGVLNVQIGGPHRIATTRAIPTTKSGTLTTWLPLIALPIIALFFQTSLRPWAFTWAIAVSIYAGCKWASWRVALNLPQSASRRRSLGYLLAWPGMDAPTFLSDKSPAVTDGNLPRLLWAIAKILTGAAIFLAAAKLIPTKYTTLAGWLGAFGLILILHFGCFELLARAWQSAGVRAEPIMRAPLRSKTLGEFWGVRWNRAFRDLAHAWILKPLLPKIGPTRATLAVFLTSGMVHELVISLPARAGFSLPTLYFLIQYLGVRFEKSPYARRHIRGRAARAFAVAATLLPLPMLFHPPFITRVIVPFMHAIAGTKGISP